ncbi:hypothetical protein [Lysobacter enzymogenes]|uniref:hypothetical protein n=1 Tax=Lysobacter enzymogenes TaxID=69 RepID=UPI0019D0F46D|nr:hypothetical protein [Lysobacter enzymogenes]
MHRRQFISVPLAAGAAVSTGVALSGFPSAALAASIAPSERISVLDFIPADLRAGVLDGTGSADLTAYIQAAIDTRPGVFLDVQFPTGVYRFDGILRVLRSHIWLSGENATLLHGGSGDAIQLGDGTNRWDRIQIGGFDPLASVQHGDRARLLFLRRQQDLRRDVVRTRLHDLRS